MNTHSKLPFRDGKDFRKYVIAEKYFPHSLTTINIYTTTQSKSSICIMGKSSDFQFWEENLPLHPQDCMEVEYGMPSVPEDQAGACSPPLWRRVSFRQETSPLQWRNRNTSCPSPTSRWQAIADGRKERMEMSKDIPESSYEFSLKYMVDDPQNNEDVQVKEVIVEEEKKVKRKTENGVSQVNRYPKSSQLCRTESMETEVFLLKTFLPASLSFNKKSTAGQRLTNSPDPSEKPAAKKWWKMVALAVKPNRNNNEHIVRSKSDISSHRTRLDESTLIPCRHSFNKKPKSRRQRGCLF